MIENQYILLGFCFLDIFQGDHWWIRILEGLKDALQNTSLIDLCFNDKAQLKLIPWNQHFNVTVHIKKESSHTCTLPDSSV